MTYEPDIAIPPGETIREAMQARGLSPRESAFVIPLLNGDLEITPEIAQAVEILLGIPADLLLELERNYRATLARLADKRRLL